MFLIALAGCTEAPSSRTLATVDGQTIDATAFRYWWDQRRPAEDTGGARQALLNELIERQALVQQAKAAGLDRDPEVAAQLESLLIARLKEQQLQPRLAEAAIDETEARNYYDAHKTERFTTSERTRVAVLWFDTRGQKPLEDRYRPRLEAARAMVQTQAARFPSEHGFGELAIAHSEHRATRYTGGDLGWLEAGAFSDGFRSEVLEVAAELKTPGALSPVVAGKTGLFVVRLMERRPAVVREFAEVRSEIERSLLRKRRSALEAEFVAAAQEGRDIRKFPQALSGLSGLKTHEPEDLMAQLPSSFTPIIP